MNSSGDWTEPVSLHSTACPNAVLFPTDDQYDTPDAEASSGVDDALQYLKRTFEMQLTYRDKVAKRQNESLYDEINTLRQKATRVDNVLAENERLREELKQYRTRQVIETTTPAFDMVSVTKTFDDDPQIDGDPGEETSTEPEFVLHSTYISLYKKCEALRKGLDLAKKQGGIYRKSYLTYKGEYEKLKLQRQKDKATVKSWQEYLDRLQIKRQGANMAYGVLGEYLQVAGNPPDPMPPSTVDENTCAISKSVPPESSVPDKTKGRAMREVDQNEVQNAEGIDATEIPRQILPAASHTAFANIGDGANAEILSEMPAATCQHQSYHESVEKDHYDGEATHISSPSAIDDPKASTSSNASRVVQSSQTTEDEEEIVDRDGGSLHMAPDADSDPVVVSCRVVKRKRFASKDQHHNKDETIIVKEEPSSSPLSYTGLGRLFQNESMDLNDFLGNVITPRKKSRYALVMPRIGSPVVPRELANDSNMGRPASASVWLHVENLPDDHVAALTAGFRQDEPILRPAKTEFPRSPPISVELEHAKQEIRLEPVEDSHGCSRALRPLNANNIILPRTGTKRPKSQRQRRPTPPIAELAEDGERFLDSDAMPPVSKHSRTVAHGVNPIENRLTTLLETPSSNRQPLGPRNTSEHVQQSLQKTNQLPSKRIDLRKTLNTPLQTPRVADNTPGLINPDEEPLRVRPLKTLSLNDFKINPNSNQGYNYAFTEVVRNQDQRRCLPNCTRPECCGDRFRKMVELGGVSASIRRLWDSSQKDDDLLLLEDYMGADSGRLKSMGPEERQEMLLKAKAEQLGNTYGRHRQAFQRPRTPPGYWRADFPSTQEAEVDKAESRKLERETVEERYREAMRPNGRWMFRDE